MFDGVAVIARNACSYDGKVQVELPEHIEALVAVKPEARKHRSVNSLTRAVPVSRDLLVQAAERGDNIGSLSAAFLRLLDRYGAAALELAVQEALDAGVPHPNAVRQALERRRTARGTPPVALVQPKHARRQDTPVRPHRLNSYDQLSKGANDDE